MPGSSRYRDVQALCALGILFAAALLYFQATAVCSCPEQPAGGPSSCVCGPSPTYVVCSLLIAAASAIVIGSTVVASRRAERDILGSRQG